MQKMLRNTACRLAACRQRATNIETGVALAALSLLPKAAFATTSGGSMPYSSWLQTFKTSVSGEIAQTISIVVIVGGVIGWVIAGQLEGLLMIIARIGIGLALVVGAAALLTSISTSGALL